MWRSIAKSIAGVSHARHEAPCQDAVAVVVNDGRLLMAVADGAGSAACGKVGAALAARRLLEAADEHFIAGLERGSWERPVRRCFFVARRRLEEAARCFGRPVEQLATTALVVMATSDAVLVGHIGDGGCVALTSAGEFVTVSAPKQGRYANETYFLTHDDYADQITTAAFRGGVLGVAAFTDGLQGEILDERGRPRVEFLGPLFRWVAELSPELCEVRLDAFMNGPELRSRSDDDLTLAIAVRVSP